MKKMYLTLREILEKKPGIYALLTFVITLIVTSAAAFRMYELTVAEEQQKAVYAANALRDQVELTLNYGLSATRTIALLIEHGSLPADFERVAEKTLQSYPVLDAVELGPNGIVSHVYPYEQNKTAIGFNILSDSVQRAEAADAIKQQKLIFAGPLHLVQGGIGVVGRLPVFITTNNTKRFWGFSLVVIKIDRLLALAKSDELKLKGYNFQLRRMVPASSTIDTFANKHLSLTDPVILNIAVPNGHWELLIAPVSGWNALNEIIPFTATRVLLSCFFALFVWYIGKQPQRLSRLVSKKTEELKFSDAKFQSYVENAPNIITIIDAGGRIKYLNKTEPGTSLVDYLGKNVFDIVLPQHRSDMRNAVDTTLRTHAMSFYLTSATVNTEQYWFENMVGLLNPNNVHSDLIITSINITERKKSEEDIRRKSEENKFLADASAMLSECNSEDAVYSLISTLLLRLVPGSSIFVMKITPDGQRSILVNIGGIESSVLSFGIKVLQFNPVGMSFDNTAGYAELFCKPRLHKFEGGLYELACGYIPKFAAEQIEKLLHVSAFYSIGIAQENSYLGYIHLFTKEELAVNPGTIESFVHQCHLALSKIISQTAMLEEALRRRTLMHTSSDGMAIINQNHAVVECNPRFAVMLGYTMEEVASLHTWDWEETMTEADIRKAFGDLTTINMTFETRHCRKDGSTYDVEVGASGTMVGGEPMVFVVCRDITFRKQSENAVRESEKQYRTIVEGMSIGVAIHVNNSIVFVNDIMVSLMGAESRSRFLGRSVIEFVHPDDRQKVMEAIQSSFVKTAGPSSGQQNSIEERLIKVDGSIITVEASALHIDYQGSPALMVMINDITERKKAEEALRLSESYNRSLLDTSPNSTSVLDLNGNLTYANSQALQMYGHAPDENIVGKSIFDWVPDTHKDFVRLKMSELLTGATLRNLELQLLKANGEMFWAEIHASSVTSIDGAPSNFLVITTDITERKLAEKALQKSEVRYRNIVENLRQAYYESDKRAVFTYCNPGLIILSGYSEEELAGSVSFRIVAKQHRLRVMHAYKQWMKEKQTDMSIEFIVHTKNGEEYWVEQTSHFEFDETGSFIKATNFVKDITKRKFSEEKLRTSEAYNKAIINTIPDLLFVHDSSGNIVDYHAPEIMPLLLSPDRFMGKHFRDFLPPDIVSVVEKSFAEALQSKKMSVYTYSLPLPGEKRHFEARLLTFEGNKVLNIIRDITDKVVAENQIKLLNAELEDRVARRTAQLTEAVSELEAFSYSVSHDLRAPLRSIDGYTALLAERYTGQFDNEGKRLLANVHNSIDKMDRLIKGLLTLSRVGRSELRFAEHEMETLVRSTFEECSTEELRRKVTFVLHPLPIVTVDSTLMQQVWTNLISNAIKYSENHEHPRIEIGAEEKDDTMIFYIKDNGAGFDPKYSNKLFGIFQRLHVDNEFKGLGIGLSIVKRVIQRHGGTVWAEGKSNEGATFYFSLPITAQEH
jgi:PAS domain S-box-containing protein